MKRARDESKQNRNERVFPLIFNFFNCQEAVKKISLNKTSTAYILNKNVTLG